MFCRMRRSIDILILILTVLTSPASCEEPETNEEASSGHNNSTDSHETKNETCEEELIGADVVLVLFFMLLVGLVARYAFRSIPIPYTALLLGLGMVLGLMQIRLTKPSDAGHGVDVQGHDRWEKFAHGIDAWQRLEPELMLLVFLPALIFSSAFSLDFHITKRSFGQVMVLAGPGVVIGTALTALFVKYVFPYEWCWPKALMFGAMISATDPVAVVALLKEVGASKRLGTVIEGESLFNDGTAFVFFLLFRDMIPVTGECLNDKNNCIIGAQNCEDGTFEPSGCTHDRNFGESVDFFFHLAFGGPAVGVLFGLAATFWIQYIYNDLLTEITITLVSAYLAFYVAEDVAEVSGVLAVVALGLFMGSFAKDRISSTVHEPMHVFWEIMEYIANTLIFVFTGLKISAELFERDGFHGTWIHSREWGYAVVLYLILQVIRLFTIFSLLPFLSRMGYGMTWRDALVASWGGLRGAVGLALALIVELDTRNIPESFRSYTIFYLGFVVVATLVINGTTMPYLLKLLGVTKTSAEKLEVLCLLAKEMEDLGKKNALLCDDDILGHADQNEIMKLTDLDLDRIMPNEADMANVINAASRNGLPTAVALHAHMARQSLRPRIDEMENENSGLRSRTIVDRQHKGWGIVRNYFTKSRNAQPVIDPYVVTELAKDMHLQDMRYRLFRAVKTAYGEWLEKGYIHARQMFDLIASADAAIDHLQDEVCDWKYLKKVIHPAKWRVDLQQLKGSLGGGYIGETFDKFLSRLMFKTLSEGVLLAKTYITAHCEAEHMLNEYLKTETHSTEAMHTQYTIDQLEAAAKRVINESKSGSNEAYELIKNFKASYPEILRAIKTRLVATEVLITKQDFVEEIERAGMIENREATLIKDMLDAKMKGLMYRSLHLDLPNSKEMLHAHPLFASLTDEEFTRSVAPYATTKFLQPEAEVYGVGNEPNNVTIVIRGQVKLVSTDSRISAVGDGFGSALGVAEILLDRPRMATMVCITTTEVHKIEKKNFLNILRQNAMVKLRSWQLTGIMLTFLNPWGENIGKSLIDLGYTFKDADLLEFEPEKELRIKSAAYLLVGEVSEAGFDHTRNQQITGPAPLGPGAGVYYSRTAVKVLRMHKPEMSSILQRHSLSSTKRMFERTTSNFLKRQSPFTRISSSNSQNDPTSSGLNIIPEDDNMRRYASGHLPTVLSTTTVEMQPMERAGMDSTRSADLETRNELSRYAKRIHRKSFEI